MATTFVPPRPEELDALPPQRVKVTAGFTPPSPDDLDPQQPTVAQLAPGDLPHPDYVAQQTTTHAQTLAGRLMRAQLGQTSQQMATAPPPVPAAPISPGLQDTGDANARQLQTQINAPNLPGVPGWADRPLIPAPGIGEEGGKIAAGITRAVAGFASGMTTPKNLGLLAGTWGLGDSVVALRSLGRLVSAGFSVDMLWQAAKKTPQLVEQIRKGDTAGAAESITSMGLGAGMAGLSALHAAKTSPKAAAPEPAQEPAQPVAAQPVHGTATVSDIAGAPQKPPGPGVAATPPAPENPQIPETGPHGPVFREYHRDAPGAVRRLLAEGSGEAPGALWHPDVPGENIDLIHGAPGETHQRGYGLSKIAKWHPEVLDDLQGHLMRMAVNPETSNDNSIRLENGPYKAVIRRDWKGDPKTWLLTEYRAGESDAPSAERTMDVSGAHGDGRQTPHPDGSSTSYERPSSATSSGVGEALSGPGPTPPGSGHSTVPPSAEVYAADSGAPVPSVAETPDKETDRGPTYMGSGLGALEPLFRESKAEGDRLRAARNAALAAANAARTKPEEMKSGEMTRHYLTSERDLWAARENQTIDVVKRKVLPKIQDREALGIAREFRHKPQELQEFIDGTHPFLQEIDGGAPVWEKNLAKLMPRLREAQRILIKPTARERAADAAFTNIAETDKQEGIRIGVLKRGWRSDEYLPHALNKKGEGEVAKLPSTAGRPMGNIGKYFGFGEPRSEKYPTMVHAVADGVIPKTLDPAALFTVHADGFARARATRLLEAHLVESGLGKWGDRSSAPEGWVQLAPHTEEFRKEHAYAVPGSFDPESGESELEISHSGLYVKPFIAKALAPITDPDYLEKFPGYAKVRTAQRGLKEAILGLSGFHLLTENFMAAADIGPSGMLKSFRAPRESAATLANERDLIASGGTTSIQGSTMDAYRGMRPGTIPTRAEVIRAYLPGTKQALEAADSITRFTFENVQRRFKIWSFALHRDAWIHDNPLATPEQLAEAKKGIASYVNGTYGGLHWENMGWSRAMVGVARLVFLAPDWSGSNIALAKYAFDAPLSPREIPFRDRLAGATTKESAQARLSRAFWTKQLLGGLIGTEMLSLMFSGKLSGRPFQVLLGRDKNGEDVYMNILYRGSIGDAANLGTRIETHAREGYDKNGVLGAFTGTLVGAGVFTAGKLAPITKFGMHVITSRDDFGRDVTPGTLAQDLLPIPIVARTAQKTMFGDDSDKYLWSERILSLFGSPAQHVPPAGTHLSNGILRPNTETGRVYRRRNGR